MDRRELLKTLAVAPALTQARKSPAPNSAALARVVDLIIPRSDTPGALDAGVPVIIEADLRRSPALIKKVQAGLDDLVTKGFLELTDAGQIAMLHSMENTPFFKLVKELTVDAYYRTRQGLVEELGWHGNTHLDEFPGCTHKEHQE